MPFFQAALFFAHLCTVHLCVASVLRHQFLVSPSFCDLPVLHKQNEIRIPNRGKPVGDDEGGPALGDGEHRFADPLFRYRIHGAGGLIQNQDRRILEYGPGDGQKLPFSLAQGGTALGEQGVISLGKPPYKGIRTCHFGAARTLSSGTSLFP